MSTQQWACVRRGVMAVLVAAPLVGAPVVAGAQGNLASQGLGYATGQLSTAARGVAGASAEFDPISPINPAALALWGRAAIHFQSEPEYRTTKTSTTSDQTFSPRFPLIASGISLGDRFSIGVSFATLLDRSWQVLQRGTSVVGADQVTFVDENTVRGAIADTRFGVAASLLSNLRVGVGLHAMTGQNRLTNTRSYDTASTFVGFSLDRTVKYVGRAVSLGAMWDPSRYLGVGLSYRKGGTIEASDAISGRLARADIPDRFGVGLRSEVARGALVTMRAEHVGWSSLQPMLSGSQSVRDAWTYAAGTEVVGPTLIGQPVALRLGASTRTLPFGVAGQSIRESSVAAGLGLLLSQGRVGADVSVQRAMRSAAGGISENAWIVSLGLVVRP